MDGLNGLQDLLAKSQCGAHGEGSSGLTPPQVGQVTTLRRHGDEHVKKERPYTNLKYSYI